jgi:hypothetical protein
MEQEDVLAQVDAARRKVAETIAHAESCRESIEDTFTTISGQFRVLNDEFNGTLAHFQAETSRAKMLAQGVLDALSGATQAVKDVAAHSETGLSELAAAAQSSCDHHETGTGAIDAGTAQYSTLGGEISQLFHDTDRSAQEARQLHHERIGDLEFAVDTWLGDTGARSQLHHDGIDTAIRTLSEERLPNVTRRLDETVQAARSEIEKEQDHIRQFGEETVRDLDSDLAEARNELEDMVKRMSEALHNLQELVTDSAQALNQGAEEAKDLMSMTNIGVKTVIGLIENLRDIFNEIESAWN